MIKKLTKRTNKEDIEKMMNEQMLSSSKIGLSRHVNALAKYKFDEIAIGGAYFEDMWYETLFKTSDKIRDAKLTKKQTNELYSVQMGYGPVEPDHALKQTEHLIRMCKSELNKLSAERKREIVVDCLKHEQTVMVQYGRDFRVEKMIKDFKIKNAKRKKKAKKK